MGKQTRAEFLEHITTNFPENGAIRLEILKKHNKNFLNVIHVIGLPGTGKSWYCIRLGQQLSLDIHKEDRLTVNHIATNLLQLLKIIRKAKRGEIIICEEIGVWLGSRRAMSAENVDAGHVWDTMRKKKMIIIMNDPIRKDVDSKIQRLTSLEIQTMSLNKTAGICIVKPLRVQTNVSTGKVYRHRLYVSGKEIHKCWSGRVEGEIADDYENLKDDYLDDLYKRLERKHQDKRDKEVGKVAKKVGVVTEVESRRANLRSRGLKIKEIARTEGVGREAVRKCLVAYDQKIASMKK